MHIHQIGVYNLESIKGMIKKFMKTRTSEIVNIPPSRYLEDFLMALYHLCNGLIIQFCKRIGL